jgi:polyvinyl alcohol dehydrogenase (cytochrome)
MLKCPLSVTVLTVSCLALGCGHSNNNNKTNAGTFGNAAAEGGAPSQMPTVQQPDCSPTSTDWPMFGQNVCNTASQASAGGINITSAANLTTKWVYDKSAGAAGDVSATPAVVGGSVYFPDWGGMINRLDAASGSVVWSKSVGDVLTALGKPGNLGGFVSRDTPLVTQGLVIFGTVRDPPQVITSGGTGAYLVAISQDTGTAKWATNLELHPAGVITGSPVLDGNTLYIGVASQEEYGGIAKTFGINYQCCSFRGSAAAVDVLSGNIVWQTHTISDALFYSGASAPEGGVPFGTGMADPTAFLDAAPPPMPSGYTGVSIWSSTPVIDRKRKQVIFTSGDNYQIPTGGSGTPDGNWVDSVIALDEATGKLKWVKQLPNGGKGPSDAFAIGVSTGPDSDFGAGANLFTAMVNGAPKDLVGAGQKSGVYFALDADTGEIVWQTNIGPGGGVGGIQWGTATDGIRIYTGNNNGRGASLTLMGNGSNAGQQVTTGTWTALDTASGDILWQTPTPALSTPVSGATVNGPVTVVNGVLFGGSMDSAGTMAALNAATGDVLWQYQCGGTVYGGPAIAGGVVYWGCGYPGTAGGGQIIAKRPLGFGTSTTKGALYAFSAP